MGIYHDCPSGGYWGRDKTLDLIRRRFTWPGIAEDVREYAATCPACQGKAIHRHKSYGKIEPLPIPTDLWNAPFKEITRSLDWITGLPVSTLHGQASAYDSILTVVCRVTKYALFLLTREDAAAVAFAELFYENVECRFGTPRRIVTDRDSRVAQFAYNNSRNHTTRKSPNRLLHGFDCEIRTNIADNVAVTRLVSVTLAASSSHPYSCIYTS